MKQNPDPTLLLKALLVKPDTLSGNPFWFPVGFQQPLKHLLGASLSAQSANIPRAAAKTPRFPSHQWTLPFSCPPHFMQPPRVRKALTW